MSPKFLSIVIGVASVMIIYIARIIELKTKRDTIRGAIRENVTLSLFLIIGTSTFAGSLLEFFWRGALINPILFTVGWICAVASFAIRRQAISALGKFWSLHIEIRESHEFVQTGPFRWIRHPTYLSMILELLGMCLILKAFISLTIGLCMLSAVLMIRIKLEEKGLIEKFGSVYIEYKKTTPALFPYKFI